MGYKLILFSLFISLPLHAQFFYTRTSGSGRGDSGADGGFYFSLGAHVLLTNSSTADNTFVKERNLLAYGADSTLAYGLSFFLFGASMEYTIYDQMTDSTEVSNINTAGKMLNFAASLGLDINFVKLFYHHHFSSKYNFSNKNASGNKVELSSPTSSFTLEAKFPFGKTQYLSVLYKKVTFDNANQNGADEKLVSTSEITFEGYGLGYGFVF